MALTQYNKKRNFGKTSEPEGKLAHKKGKLIFVVQNHHASHLHYDFRLEANGVLKSWAVPKGPSMNPNDKRLAMMVEDHPYNYKDFEGNIPEGNYGAGNVIVWDNGTYVPEEETDNPDKTVEVGIRKGRLTVILKGKKLKGAFSLVKMHGRQENAWMLIKKKDDFATDEDITANEKSVISKKTLQQLADKYHNEKDGTPKSEKKKKVASKPKAKTKKQTVKKKPGRIKPMLAELTEAPFDNPDWIFEPKYDGYRVLADCNGDNEVDLYSRNLLSFNEDFASIVNELKKINHDCLLDGEVVAEDEKGVSRFQLLQNFRNKLQGDLQYYVFDLLRLDGNDLTNLPLIERKELLRMLLKGAKLKHMHFSEHIAEHGIKFFEQAGKKGWEGIIAKDAQSTYSAGARNGDWQKIKITKEQETVICGITEPKGGRKFFGSLLLGVYQDAELQYVGNCGTGFNHAGLKDLYEKLKPLFVNKSPFSERITGTADVQWIKPKLVCQVKFTEWTGDGSMRHPVFLGLRKDKKATEVKREIPVDMKKKTAQSGNEAPVEKDYDKKVGKVTLKLTNQNKLYWPEDKITKGDLLIYYEEVADVMLPYLKDRPESLHRFPNGIKDSGFFQKDQDVDKLPDWVHTEQVYSESTKENIDYLICNDKAHLLFMANLGCIEINPWNSKIQTSENPDWMVIDLDPEDIDFKEVVKAAIETRKFLDKLEIESYCKTSGATGLHIFVPLAAKYEYEIVKNFAQLIAQNVNDKLPDTTSILRMPNKRKKKVYLDFLQNRRGQTLAAPYSVRPRPGATVSTPLDWSEVTAKLDPSKFTIKTTLQRLNKKGDLWKPVIGKGANLEKAIKAVYESGND
ncbi:MAG: DNA ligase D [Chitinophagales bacterium]